MESSASKMNLTSATKMLDKAEENLESAEEIMDQLKELSEKGVKGSAHPRSTLGQRG